MRFSRVGSADQEVVRVAPPQRLGRATHPATQSPERLSPGPRLSRRRRTRSNPTARPLRSYRFPLLPPLPNAARSPSLPPGSLFSFDRRWSIFLRPLSCFCFATRTPISGGRNPSTPGSSGSASCVATSREGVRGAGSGGSLYSPLRGSGMPSLPALPPRLIVVAADHASGISVWAGRRRGSTWRPVP